MSDGKKKVGCPHKKTDFRYQLWVKERKSLHQKAKRNSFKVEMGRGRRGAVSVDTSKAKSNIDVVRTCLKELHWREYPFGKRDGGYCDVYWHGVNYRDSHDLQSGRVNKFPGMIETMRKVNLCRTLDNLCACFPEEFDFHPRSWFLPKQFAEFCDAHRRHHSKKHKPVYIVKPDEGSQGDGIYLMTDPKDYYFNSKHHVVQEYIARPLLIEGLKFDLRLYVLVTSLEPLELYIGHEGLARFCTVPYEKPTHKNLHECYMHLTNYSLNKKSGKYVHNDAEDSGSKRTMTSVFQKLESLGYDVGTLWENIQLMVIKTMIAVTPELRVHLRGQSLVPGKGGPRCFQILGFDVLLDERCKPYLLEVNANPSLRIDFEQEVAIGITEHIHSPVDEEVKKPIIMDTLLLMAPWNKLSYRQKVHMFKGYKEDYCDKEIKLPRHRPQRPLADDGSSSGQSSSEGSRHKRSSKDNSPEGRRPRRRAREEVHEREKSLEEEEDDDRSPPPTPIDQVEAALMKIFPGESTEIVRELCLMERIAELFLACLGVRGSMRMTSTGFRTFTRKCGLSGRSFTNADVDIMYIELNKRWDYMNVTEHGLCYQGFVEAFISLAKKKFPSKNDLLYSVRELLDFCETNLERNSSGKAWRTTLPPLSKRDKRMEEIRNAYGNPDRGTVGSSYHIDYDETDTRGKHSRRPKRATSTASPSSVKSE